MLLCIASAVLSSSLHGSENIVGRKWSQSLACIFGFESNIWEGFRFCCHCWTQVITPILSAILKGSFFETASGRAEPLSVESMACSVLSGYAEQKGQAIYRLSAVCFGILTIRDHAIRESLTIAQGLSEDPSNESFSLSSSFLHCLHYTSTFHAYSMFVPCS